MKLSKEQRRVLNAILNGEPFCEFLTPDPRQLAFRSLGEYVPGRLNYVLKGKRVRYQTFRFLFKNNLITPGEYQGSFSPQSGITQFFLTVRGWDILQ
jgi:hypothetical protein